LCSWQMSKNFKWSASSCSSGKRPPDDPPDMCGLKYSSGIQCNVQGWAPSTTNVVQQDVMYSLGLCIVHHAHHTMTYLQSTPRHSCTPDLWLSCSPSSPSPPGLPSIHHITSREYRYYFEANADQLPRVPDLSDSSGGLSNRTYFNFVRCVRPMPPAGSGRLASAAHCALVADHDCVVCTLGLHAGPYECCSCVAKATLMRLQLHTDGGQQSGPLHRSRRELPPPEQHHTSRLLPS
jgi:hypothetical protein